MMFWLWSIIEFKGEHQLKLEKQFDLKNDSNIHYNTHEVFIIATP